MVVVLVRALVSLVTSRGVEDPELNCSEHGCSCCRSEISSKISQSILRDDIEKGVVNELGITAASMYHE